MATKNDKTISQLGTTARLARTALAQRMTDIGIYAGQEQIMAALGRNDGLTPSQLAAELGVKAPTVTKAVNRLQEQGFVTKSASTEDARQAHVFLTESGRDVLGAVSRAVRKTEKKALDGLNKKERKRLSRMLRRMENNLLTDIG